MNWRDTKIHTSCCVLWCSPMDCELYVYSLLNCSVQRAIFTPAALAVSRHPFFFLALQLTSKLNAAPSTRRRGTISQESFTTFGTAMTFPSSSSRPGSPAGNSTPSTTTNCGSPTRGQTTFYVHLYFSACSSLVDADIGQKSHSSLHVGASTNMKRYFFLQNSVCHIPIPILSGFSVKGLNKYLASALSS